MIQALISHHERPGSHIHYYSKRGHSPLNLQDGGVRYAKRYERNRARLAYLGTSHDSLSFPCMYCEEICTTCIHIYNTVGRFGKSAFLTCSWSSLRCFYFPYFTLIILHPYYSVYIHTLHLLSFSCLSIHFNPTLDYMFLKVCYSA